MFFKKITLANRLITSKLNEILKDYEINATDWRIISYLSTIKSASLKDISSFYMMDKALTSRVSKKLENLGLLGILSSNDKREKNIYLTLKGKEIFFDANMKITEYENNLVKDFDFAKLGIFINILDNINDNFKE